MMKMEEEARKVRATWYRIVYNFTDVEYDYWIDTTEYDKKETDSLGDAVVVKKYASVDEAVRDFLDNRATDDTEEISIESNCVSQANLPKERRIWIEHDSVKKDENGDFVHLGESEIEEMYDKGGRVSYYFMCDILDLKYADGTSANADAREVYRKNRYRNKYLKRFAESAGGEDE